MTNKNSHSYFEKVYPGKKNKKVSISENKRLQKLLSVKAFNRSGDSVKAEMKFYRPVKKENKQSDRSSSFY